MKKLKYIIVLLIIVISSLIFAAVSSKKPSLTTNYGSIDLLIADTPLLRQRGLSGRSELDENTGMLFLFDSAKSQNCFWMKDMNFAIDMIWLDSDKNVVSVEQNVTPETFPSSFCPEVPALYGLEVNSGIADELKISNGVKLNF